MSGLPWLRRTTRDASRRGEALVNDLKDTVESGGELTAERIHALTPNPKLVEAVRARVEDTLFATYKFMARSLHLRRGRRATMNTDQLHELILQSLEHEQGGVKVYSTALKCVVNDDLKEEWEKYLNQTRNHVQVLQTVCEAFGIDPEEESPGRDVVRNTGVALVEAMEEALGAGEPTAAQLVACECVVLAETKDHADWELLTAVSEKLSGEEGEALQKAVEEVEDEEDEHLYHSKGWCRELWLESLGLRAVLPPPEERKDVKTAIGAARAEQARDEMR